MEAVSKILDDIAEYTDSAEDRHSEKMHQKPEPTRWFAVRTGAGLVTGYIEMFLADSLGCYVTIPGASRYVDVSELPERQN